MFERLDKLREEVRHCEKRRDLAEERLKTAQAKLKEAEASQILSDVGAMKLTPEEVARILQFAASDGLKAPATNGTSVSKESSGNGSDTESSYESDVDKEDTENENYEI